MYAIIESGGKQFRVEQGSVIDVELLGMEEGAPVEFSKVLFLHDGTTPKVGLPYVTSARVKGELLAQVKGPKVLAFKYKQRKGVRRAVGHRQKYDRVKITEITG